MSAQGKGEEAFCLSASSFYLVQDSSSDSPIWILTLRATLGNRKRQKCQLPFWLVFTASTQEIWTEYPTDLGWHSSEFPRKQQIFVKCAIHCCITRAVLLQDRHLDRHFGLRVILKETKHFSLVWKHQKFSTSRILCSGYVVSISRFHMVTKMKMWEASLVVQPRWQRVKVNLNKIASHISDWHLILIRFLVLLLKISTLHLRK